MKKHIYRLISTSIACFLILKASPTFANSVSIDSTKCSIASSADSLDVPVSRSNIMVSDANTASITSDSDILYGDVNKDGAVTEEDADAVSETTLKDCPQGDVNADGELTMADVVLLQKWLLAVPDTHLENWKAADLCEDNRLDVFDLCLMRRLLIDGNN